MSFKAKLPTEYRRRRPATLSYLATYAAFYLSTSMTPVTAQATGCTPQTIDRLEREADNIRNWHDLQTLSHRYKACRIEDAEVETEVSTFITRMLTDRWDTLSTAAGLFRQDPTFETFALAGINITDSADDLKRIDNLAAERCPADLRILCRKIRRSVRENN